jgi:hypothetical protein
MKDNKGMLMAYQQYVQLISAYQDKKLQLKVNVKTAYPKKN